MDFETKTGLNRRQLALGGLAAGAALTAGGRLSAAQADDPATRVANGAMTLPAMPMDGLTGGFVRIPTFDREIMAYRVYPTGRLRDAPVVVFAPMIIGMCSPMHQDFTRRLAKSGFYAIMPNLPERRHPNACAEYFTNIVRDMVANPVEAEQHLDINAAYAFAAKEGASASKIGMLGYDGGARTTYKTLSRNPQILAGVAYSGPLVANPISRPGETESHPTPVEVAHKMGGRVLGIYGDNEGSIRPEHIAEMKAALVAAGDTRSQILVYPGRHGFITDFGTTQPSKEAWDKGVAWLNDHGVRY